MLFKPHPDSPVPIYEQIVSQVIFAVAADGLAAGEIIPSVRDLAQRVLAHPNTVARAYQELERRGVLVAKRGVGMEVTADAPRICREQRQEIVRGQVREALRSAVASAMSPDDIRRLVDDELNHVNGEARAREKSS
ncbi:MAG TPA: GntR family transcriptional regulator [Gemmataceae bacterium]|jgi:GntR family transcriptional regulator